MGIWISRNGQNFGPYTVDQLEVWLAAGTVAQGDHAWEEGQQWRPLGDLLREKGRVIPPPPVTPPSAFHMPLAVPAVDDATTLRRIADYERVSGILWIVLGSIQCITLVGIMAGVWNIVAGVSRVRAAPLILARDPGVPSMFEGVAALVVIGLVNVFLGGAIGVVLIVFDFVVRDMVLKHRHLFAREMEAGAMPVDDVQPRPP